ncbi:BTB/POZ and MATH domain-containing protein 2 [Striga hermonthica]|uniref:BTB/POZ and MATH domain-containing protein 2 n=1 Tax=Striga hermonthica TaxID=68872 RepID=A0A9N7NGF3_STRHE|nr:BTB/POZ and MATH domain-containing protein 2 [Striga hermonthica]
MEMETLTEVVRSSKQIKFHGFSMIPAMSDGDVLKSSRWNVGGYDWEVQLFPKSVLLYLYLRSEVRTDSGLKVTFSARLVDPSGKLKPHQGNPPVSYYKFNRSGESCYGGVLTTRSALETSGYLKDDAFIVECTLAVLREVDKTAATRRPRPADDLVPSSGLHHHLGELLQKGMGSDVTLVAAGESFAVHKAILASRSPVFMAEFFGDMKEKRSPRVEIEDMDAAILGAMLRFIYTDTVPEPAASEDGGAGATHMAQHLLAAADRYGIDGLKVACEDRLYDGVSVDTAATTLALAEQHGCYHLKARCVELIAANLEAVMATEGYKHLKASCCPSVMDDLLMAVHRRKN